MFLYGHIYVKHMVNIYETHCQPLSNNRVEHHQQTWSTIVEQRGQQSSKHMVKHPQKHGQPSSTIIKQHSAGTCTSASIGGSTTDTNY
jgi:hypothetical protein